MSKWSDFYYKKLVNPESRAKFCDKYNTYLNRLWSDGSVENHCQVEFGCGTGIVSHWLHVQGRYKSSLLLDNDKEMLKLAEMQFAFSRGKALLEHDIRNPVVGSYGLAHSHGVLEHFSNDDIKTIVRNMRNCADTVMCYVPSNRYSYKSFGDERLMSPKQWRKICEPKEIIEFNDGYDLILKWH